jgi:hypothetical protein
MRNPLLRDKDALIGGQMSEIRRVAVRHFPVFGTKYVSRTSEEGSVMQGVVHIIQDRLNCVWIAAAGGCEA